MKSLSVALLMSLSVYTASVSGQTSTDEQETSSNLVTESKDAGSVSSKDPFSTQTLVTQILLDRLLFSPGAIDGKPGRNTDAALESFQLAHSLPQTGKMDEETSRALQQAARDTTAVLALKRPLVPYRITEQNTATHLTPDIPSRLNQQTELPALNYEDLLELMAERFHSTPELLERLNPGKRFESDTVIEVPNVRPTLIMVGRKNQNKTTSDTEPARVHAAPFDTSDSHEEKTSAPAELVAAPVTIIASKKDTVLSVVDKNGKLVFHAPVTAGSQYDPLPIGKWKVNGTEYFPVFHYNPSLFWDAKATDKKAIIPAGPNNPVGVAWLDLSIPHYGIHGTPEPSQIGYTESHGCVRLTNWDVLRLSEMVKPGTKVYFVETARERVKKMEEIRDDAAKEKTQKKNDDHRSNPAERNAKASSDQSTESANP